MKKSEKKVQILMSTYNGEKYLQEQLDSILAQTYPNIEILIRDDGSKDATLEILEEYAKKQKRITYIKGKNCGAAKSFFQLLKKADKKADYYAFSDQDDIWEINKIERAVKWLERQRIILKTEKEKEIPVMYCSALKVVDQQKNVLYIEGKERKTRDLSFGNALVENCCTGCTIVINQKLQKMVAQKRIPECSMHDWWLYMTASCFGKVIYDRKPCIQYRQHEENVVGMEHSRIDRLKKKIRGFHKGRNVISYQLMEFYRLYHPKGEKGKLLKQFLYAKKHPIYRVFLIMNNKIYRQRKIDTIICKILIVTGSM